MSKPTAFSSIKTKYLGPTNYRGSRVSVTDDGGFDSNPRRLVVGWDYALDTTGNHAAAAAAWIEKFIDLPFRGSSKPTNAHLVETGMAFNGEYFWTWEVADHYRAEEATR